MHDMLKITPTLGLLHGHFFESERLIVRSASVMDLHVSI